MYRPDWYEAFSLDFRLGSVIVFAALSAGIARRYPAARLPVLFAGPVLTLLAWFAPYLALGFGLFFLAYHTGRNAFLGAATVYLGCGVCLYYYNLQLGLLYKSLVLMGSGAVFLALGVLAARLTTRERAQ
jgi:uncharacterized membrane protein